MTSVNPFSIRAKSAVRKLFVRFGYRLVKLRPGERYQPSRSDEETTDALLADLMPAAEQSALVGEFPQPRHIKNYFTPVRASMMRLLLDQCDNAGVMLAGRKVFDLGCHGGLLLRVISQRYPAVELHGGETNEHRRLVASHGCPEADIFVTNVAELSPQFGFDVIFFTEVLEHLVNPEEAIRQLLAATSKHGTVVLTVPDGRDDRFPAMQYSEELGAYAGHVNFWSPESWRHYFERYFSDIDVQTAKLSTGQLFAALSKR